MDLDVGAYAPLPALATLSRPIHRPKRSLKKTNSLEQETSGGAWMEVGGHYRCSRNDNILPVRNTAFGIRGAIKTPEGT